MLSLLAYIISILAYIIFREKLIAHLPSDSTIPKTEAELKETLHSAQFKQACNAFSRKSKAYPSEKTA